MDEFKPHFRSFRSLEINLHKCGVYITYRQISIIISSIIITRVLDNKAGSTQLSNDVLSHTQETRPSLLPNYVPIIAQVFQTFVNILDSLSPKGPTMETVP